MDCCTGADFSLFGGHQFPGHWLEWSASWPSWRCWWLLAQMREIPPAFRLTFAAACGIVMTTIRANMIIILVCWYLTQLHGDAGTHR